MTRPCSPTRIPLPAIAVIAVCKLRFITLSNHSTDYKFKNFSIIQHLLKDFLSISMIIEKRCLQICDTDKAVCRRCDLITVIYTRTKQGRNMLLLGKPRRERINHNYRPFFCTSVKLKVSKQVTYLLPASHSERNEPVSLTPSPAYKREPKHISIKHQYALRLPQLKITCTLHNFNPETSSIEIINPRGTDNHYIVMPERALCFSINCRQTLLSARQWFKDKSVTLYQQRMSI